MFRASGSILGLMHSRSSALPTYEDDDELSKVQVWMRRPLQWRRDVLRRPWERPVIAMHVAAAVIQRAWRPNWLRQVKPSQLQPKPVEPVAPALPSLPEAPPEAPESPKTKAPPRRGMSGVRDGGLVSAFMRQRYLDLLKRQYAHGASISGHVYESYRSYCAALIQAYWRSHKDVKAMRLIKKWRPFKLYSVAAFEIQRYWRESVPAQHAEERATSRAPRRSYMEELEGRMEEAAEMIQNLWRSYTDYKIYESLRDTVTVFNRSGDPCLLLKSILPREALILDQPMQVHARFRLGGHRFPPSIYYKVFTHGNVVDICAFAPRNYAGGHEAMKLGPVYERMENNGWRPLDARLAPTGVKIMDEVEAATTRTRLKNFHYSRVKRKQDVEVQRRHRTIEWMRKLYGLYAPEAADVLAAREEQEEQQAEMSRQHSLALQQQSGSLEAPLLQNSAFPQQDMLQEPITPPMPVAVGAAGGASGAARLANKVAGKAAPAIVPRRPAGMAPVQFYSAHRRRMKKPNLDQNPWLAPPPRPQRELIQRSPTASSYSGGEASVRRGAGDTGGQYSDLEETPAANREGADVSLQDYWNQMDQRQDVPGMSAAELLPDDDELLEWSRRLDFDAYMDGWQRIATTNDSEGALRQHFGQLKPVTVGF
eukprot:TRINITY_DN13280_c0_g1_i1.p1 TRINITY_DN13280_c0_g1~~TRINITY_DN13280_c0_g1_i1.p1  ORF type:complete len:652 (+),score=137.82 TRINITY_DN13280_c0_g1_i1:190-2145(+)